MNAAARAVMAELPDITIAYGVSDEYRHEPKLGSLLQQC
jgi:tRNA(His) 5'-end guanylyltransferase